MSTASFLHFLFKYNTQIIEGLFLAFTISSLYLAIRWFWGKGDAESLGNMSGLEESLKKLIESQAVRSGNSTASVTSSGGSSDAETARLRKELESLKLQYKEQSVALEEAKAASPGAGGGGEAAAPAGNSALETKVQDLEARLAEYAIIEDDIADLSFYKEETVKLQGEVEKLKARIKELEAGATVASSPAPASAPAAAAPSAAATPQAAPTPASTPAQVPTPAPTQSAQVEAVAVVPAAAAPAEPIVPQAAESVPVIEAIAEPSIEAATSAPAAIETASAATTSDAFEVVDNDIMAEFQAAVEAQKQAAAAGKTGHDMASRVAAAAEQALTVATEALAEPKQGPVGQKSSPELSAQDLVDQALAANSIPVEVQAEKTTQVEAAPDGTPVAETPSSETQDQESINMDKMLSEASNLVTSDSTAAADNALEAGLDTDKLLEEAKLMDNFDTFVSNKEKAG